MKYEKEINEFIKDILYMPCMTDEEYQEIKNEFFKEAKLTKQDMSDMIQEGVEKGVSVENQIIILKHLISKYK